MKEPDFKAPHDYTGIHFFNHSGGPIPIDLPVIQIIADHMAAEEDCRFDLVEVVFVDADEILRINREHLRHDYVTDIITFGYVDDAAPQQQAIEGTLYCCAPRIAEQAGEHQQPEETEYRRVVIHGLLHLAGYSDKTDAEQAQMREREDHYLGLL